MKTSQQTRRLVLVRADGNKSIGMGHLARSCLIANALSGRGYEVHILVKRNVEAARFLESRAMIPDFLPEDIPIRVEIDRIRSQLAKTAGVLVLDVLNYRDYSLLFDKLRISNCLSAVIFDDESTEVIGADVVLNGNPAQLPEYYADHTCSRYLVGPNFFIMDSRYKGVTVPTPRGHVSDVLVTLGGSDHHDLLFKLIRVFNRFGDRYRVRIASTTATGYVERLKVTLREVRFPFELHFDAPSLVDLWRTCDVAITAGGNTLFERISTRLPGATLCQLKSQVMLANVFERLGVNINLGHGLELDENYLFVKLERFLNDSAEHKRQHVKSFGLVDSGGLESFIAAIDTHETR